MPGQHRQTLLRRALSILEQVSRFGQDSVFISIFLLKPATKYCGPTASPHPLNSLYPVSKRGCNPAYVPICGVLTSLSVRLSVQMSLATALTVNCLGATIKAGKANLLMPAKKGSSLGEKKKGPLHLQKCPACSEMTLFWDKCTNQGVCLNAKCKLSGR